MESKKNLVIKKVEECLTMLFFCASIFVLILLTQALLLTWLNQFKIEYLLIGFVVSVLLTIVFFRLIKNDIKIIPHLNIVVLSIIFLFCLILIFFPHDSFGGRDEGMYSGMAIILSKNHGLSVPSYLYKTPLLYGSTNETLDLTKSAYVVWLAIQIIFFGAGWMFRSNIILISLGLCSLFLVSTLIAKRSVAFITVLLLSTCMPFLWFSRETMTENMSFFLLWFLILSTFLFVKTKKNYYLVSLFLSSWLFSFTRNEGLFIQIPVFVILTTILLIRKTVSLKRVVFISVVYILLIISAFYINNKFLPLGENINFIEAVTNINNYMGKSNLVRLGDRFPLFIFHLLSKQNLSIAIYSFILIMVLVAVGKRSVVKDNILYICLLGIISVEFLKLINPSVTLEQPWMYRRYIYSLLPLGYLSLSILLNDLVEKKFLNFIFCCLLLTNIILSSRIITLRNSWLITGRLEHLAQNISSNDFVIVDGNDVIGNYFPMSYLAYHKEIRSLYKWWIEIGDWQPKEKKFQGIPYSRLFLLSNIEDSRYMNFRLKKIGAVEIESKQLQVNCDLTILRNELKLKTSNIARLPYLDVTQYCNKIDNEIINLKKKLILYELFYE